MSMSDKTVLHTIPLLLKLSAILTLLMFPLLMHAQPIKEWDRGFGGSGYENCNTVIQTTDLGYVLGGNTSGAAADGDVSLPTRDDTSIPFWIPNSVGDYWVTRIDEDGNLEWDARFGGNKSDILWSLVETDDGGFLFGGESFSDMGGERSDTSRGVSDYWIIKTDAMGVQQWDRSYGGDSTDSFRDMIKTADGGYLLGGWSLSTGWNIGVDSIGEKSAPNLGGTDWWIVKINATGDIEWEKTYGGDQNDRLNTMYQTADGGYVLGGGTDSDVSGDVTEVSRGSTDWWVLRIDPTGNIIWQERYGGNEADELNEIIPTADGGMFLAGSSLTMVASGEKADNGYGSIDWWVMKTDVTGAIIEWQHTIGSDDLENIYSITQNSIDHFILGGFSRSANTGDVTDPPKGGFDFWMVYLDPAGTKLWDRRFGGNDDDVMENVFQTDDGGYLLAGHSRTDVDQDKSDPSNGQNDFWVIKTICDLNINFQDTIVCPNDDVILSAYDPNCIGCTYAWSDAPGNTDSIRMVTAPSSSAIYSVTLTDGVGCQKEDDIEIQTHTPPTLELGADQQICEGQDISLNAENNGATYLWSTAEISQSITADTTGVYAVTVTDGNTCTVQDSIQLMVNDLPEVELGNDTIICQGNSVFLDAGNDGVDYDWSIPLISGSSVPINISGIFSVTVTDANNCVSEDAITIDVIPFPTTVSMAPIDAGPHCPGASFDISLDNSGIGIDYQLYNGVEAVGNPVAGNGGNILLPTQEIYTTTNFGIIANSAALCADTFNNQVLINIGDILAPSIICRTDTTIIIDGNNCDPSITTLAPIDVSDNCGLESLIYTLSGATTASSPLTGINDAGSESYEIGLTTVNYTAIDSFGNTAFCGFFVEIIDNSLPLVGNSAEDMTVECDGMGNTAAFNDWLSNRGGASALAACSALTWTTVPANPVLSDDCGATGSVTVTFVATTDQGNSISTTATFSIVDTQAPDFTVPANIAIDQTDDLSDLTLTGDVNDEMDNCDVGVMDGGPREAIYTDSIATGVCFDLIYRKWSLSDECGNTNEQTQRISVAYTTPTAMISGTQQICEGDTALITFSLAGNGNSFDVVYATNLDLNVLDDISDGYILEVYPTETTTYGLISVQDDARPDCIANLSGLVTIEVIPAPQISNVQEACNALNTSYVVTFDISSGDPGSYMVTGGMGTLVGGVFTSDPIERDSAYTFLIEDANGCNPVEVSGAFDCACMTDAGAIAQSQLTVCGDEVLEIALDNEFLDGNDILQFVLHDGDAGMIGNILQVSNTPQMAYFTGLNYGQVYYVTAIAGTEDGNGNIDTDDTCLSTGVGVPIVFYEAPILTITPTSDYELSCTEITLSFTGSISNSQGGLAYEWNVVGADGNIVGSNNNATVNVDEAGEYQLVVTDLVSTCTVTENIIITTDEDNPIAVAQAAPTITCYNSSVSLNAAGSSTGPDFSYQWTGGSVLSGAQSLTPVVDDSGFFLLTVTNDSNGCTSTVSVEVSEDTTPPQVEAGTADSLDCIVTEINLGGSFNAATNDINLRWVTDNGNIISGENTLSPLVNEAGIYTLEVINLDNGCVAEDGVEVSLDDSAPQGALIETNDPICFDESNGSVFIDTVYGGIQPFTYSIDGVNFFASNLFNGLSAGTYDVVVQDATGCEWETQITLNNPSALTVVLEESQVINLGDSLELNAIVNQAIDTLMWESQYPVSCDTCLNTFIRPESESGYRIRVMNEAGCVAEDYVVISVRKDRSIYIPTAFSPNGDGSNDYFTIYSDQSVANISVFRIYDRWGASIFEARNLDTNAPLKGWDGTFKGKTMQPGVYIYYAEIEFFDGLKEIYKGDITVME